MLWVALWAACGGGAPPAGTPVHAAATATPEGLVAALGPEVGDAVGRGLRLRGEPLAIGAGEALADAALACDSCGCGPIPLGGLVAHRGRYLRPDQLDGVTQRVSIDADPGGGKVAVVRAVHDPAARPLALRWPEAWSLVALADGAAVTPVRRGGWVFVPPATDVRLEGGGPPGEGQRVDAAAVVVSPNLWFPELPQMVASLDTVPGMTALRPAVQQAEGGADAWFVAYRHPAVAGQEGVRVIVPDGEAAPEQLLTLVLAARRTFPDFPRPVQVYAGASTGAAGNAVVLGPGAMWSPRGLDAGLARVWLEGLDPALVDAVAAWASRAPAPAPPACVWPSHPAAAGADRVAGWVAAHGEARVIATLSQLRATPGAGFDAVDAALQPAIE